MTSITGTNRQVQPTLKQQNIETARQHSKWPTFCKEVDSLSQELQRGSYIEQAIFDRIQKQLSQFLKKNRSPEAQNQLIKTQKKFTDARACSLKTCLDLREDPWKRFVFTPIQTPQSGMKSTLLRIFHFASMATSNLHGAAVGLSNQALQPFNPAETCPPPASLWQLQEPQCIPLKQKERVLSATKDPIPQAPHHSLPPRLTKEDSVELIGYEHQFSHPVHLGDALLKGKRAVSGEVYANWKRFLSEIEKLTQNKIITKWECRLFSGYISFLEETGALPYFVTLLPKKEDAASFFDWTPFFSKESTDLQAFRKSLRENRLELRAPAKDLSEKQKQTQQILQQVSRFSNPDLLPAAWQELQQFIATFSDPDWLHQWQTAPDSIRLLAYRAMEQALNLLDTSLEAVKTSSLGEPEKDIYCKKMLESYFLIMKNWALELVPENALKLTPSYRIENYLEQIHQTLTAMSSSKEKKIASPAYFNVLMSMFSRSNLAYYHIPQTIEEMTRLLRENCLAWISILNKEALSSEILKTSQFPKKLQTAMKFLEDLRSIGVLHLSQLRRIDIEKTKITIQYSIPSHDNSSNLELVYDLQSKQIIFQGPFSKQVRELQLRMAR